MVSPKILETFILKLRICVVLKCQINISKNIKISTISEQFTNEQENVDAFPGETVKLITELPESGLEVTWLKDNVPLSMIDVKYETINKDCSYQLLVANVTSEDSGQGGGFESRVSLSVLGKCLENIHETFRLPNV